MSRNFLVFIFPFVLIGFAKAILRQIRRRVNMHCFQKSAQSRLFFGRNLHWRAPKRLFFAASCKRGRAGRIFPPRLLLKGGAKAGSAEFSSGYLYAGGFSASLSEGISRLESGAFSHVLSVVVASTSGVRAGPTAPQLNPMLSHEHSNAAADKASIAEMAVFIAELNATGRRKFRKRFFRRRLPPFPRETFPARAAPAARAIWRAENICGGV